MPHIDYKTILTILVLLLVDDNLEKSGFLRHISHLTLGRIKNTPGIIMASLTITAAIAPVLTNDAALFAVLPVMRHRFAGSVPVLLIALMTAMANASSALTPIGNPQNAFLWHLKGCTFLEFVLKMLPITIVAVLIVYMVALLLFLFRRNLFQSRVVFSIPPRAKKTECKWTESILWIGFFAAEIYFLNRDAFRFAFWLVFTASLIAWLIEKKPPLTKNSLIFLGILILMTTLPSFLVPITVSIFSNATGTPFKDFISGVAVSQLVSNVPAAVLLSPSSKHIFKLAWGVNLGGNGLLWSSLANLIGLRFLKKRDIKSVLEFQGVILLCGTLTIALTLLLLF